MPKHHGRRYLVIAFISIFMLTGPGTAMAYPFTSATSVSVNSQPNGLAVADFNGDGVNDLAVPNYNADTVSILLGVAGGSFAAPVTFATGPQPSSLTAADFNEDGKLDLVVAIRGADRVTFFPGNGDGTFGAGSGNGAGSQPYSVITSDFDLDGNKDVAVANINGDTISVLLGNGAGAFAAQVTYASGLDPVDLVARDFDGDGYPDLAVANSCAGCFLPYNTEKVSVLLNRGNGAFNPKVDYAATRGLTGVEATDLNGDTYQDLIVSRRNSNNVGVFLGDGHGAFGAMTTFNTETQPQDIVSGDFNRDSKNDVAVANGGSNTVSLLLGNGDGTLATQATTSVATQPRMMSYADINGDGKGDLLATHSTLGTVNILFDADPPVTASLSPSSAVQNSSITIFVDGSGFSPTSVVRKDGADLATTFVNTTRLQTSLSSSDTANAATLSLAVFSPTQNASSSAMTFTVTAAPPPTGAPPPIDLMDPPKGPFGLQINDGSGRTNLRQLDLNLSAGSNVARMAISRTADFSDAAQIPFLTTKQWDLCSRADGTVHSDQCPPGDYVLYARFFTKYGQPSPTISRNLSFGTTVKTDSSISPKTNVGLNGPTDIIKPTFRRTMRLGTTGEDVRQLQKYLNAHGFIVSTSGPGSTGNETALFGQGTMAALKKFQSAHAPEILAPSGLTSGTGFFGPATLAYVNAH